MIYHYCSLDVFHKIAKTKNIWLSDITKMEDKTEYKSGFDVINKIVMEFFGNDTGILNGKSHFNINDSFKVLIACFSHHGDMLSQWRKYGDDEKGVSIGFNRDKIVQHNLFNRYLEGMEPISSKVSFMKINYKLVDFEVRVKEVIKQFESSTALLKHKMLARALMYMAISYKDEFFKEEDEVRAIITIENEKVDNYEIKLRCSNYGEAFYHELNTGFKDIQAIEKVIIGPKCEITTNELLDILKENNLRHVVIVNSSGKGKYR